MSAPSPPKLRNNVPAYRLFIDEVGNSDLGASSNPNHRYLSLTGIIFKIDYARNTVYPSLEDLKRRFFNSTPDKPIILHRREMVDRKPPFNALEKDETRMAFDQELLSLLHSWEYRVITVVIDKQSHVQKYNTWTAHPYHYCLTVMLERYVRWLRDLGEFGDVLAESRGGKEDAQLKGAFQRIYAHGTQFVQPDLFKQRLTSKELKLKKKRDNVAGLQIADLVAHPSYRAMKMKSEGFAQPNDFGTQIVSILESSKYHRNKGGAIQGYGQKWLP